MTRWGWPWLKRLMPSCWYVDNRFVREGTRLTAATGRVYRVPTHGIGEPPLDIVVKFSRVAQNVPLIVETSFPADADPEEIAAARFNSPMEEFGLVTELRSGVAEFTGPRILAQRPLAMYVPPEEFELWQLGRVRSDFNTHRLLLREDQEDAVKAIELDIKRMYVVLYNWIKGNDAQECYEGGVLRKDEFLDLTPRVVRELADNGFRVLDNKPRHFILRRSQRTGSLLRDRQGRLVYGLIDFELLQRTPEHQRRYRDHRRHRYWASRASARRSPLALDSSRLAAVRIFGVDYLFGHAPDGGRLWVLGDDPELLDYFMPERWHRTPRVKLSPMNEVYRTRTRDNIDVVYRRSRVGTRPRIDPLLGQGRAIREHGYNSPFEEVAIAERLREMGVASTVPRAIFRTAQRSTTASYLKDDSRFVDHSDVITPAPESEPVLTADRDYYTIWDEYRGEPPKAAGRVVDLDRAVEDGLLEIEQRDAVLERTLRRLHGIGLRPGGLDPSELVVLPNESDGLVRTAKGEIDVRVAIDALTAYDFGLLDDDAYHELVERVAARLQAVDCEGLDRGGSHLLLSMDPDGHFDTDAHDHPIVTLCNFELIRGLYRPIR
ncbi:MAG: hypothetical protein JSV80_17195 [Acidobacteriota bacterium]|nr:MAG: hypothetical protein JSV80_17195 [Acidobacteriota bacterium]